MRLWAMPDGQPMTELFVGPHTGGGLDLDRFNDDGVIAFRGAISNHSGTPKDFYRWTPSVGLESLPRIPTNPTYSGTAPLHLDLQGRVLIAMPDGIWRYDTTEWQLVAPPPEQGSLSDGQYMRVAPAGDLMVPVKINTPDGNRWRWLRYREQTGVYDTLYDVPVLKPGYAVSLQDAAVSDDGTLTFYAYSYFYTLQAEAVTQVAPDGAVTILENAGVSLETDYTRHRFNNSGDVLAWRRTSPRASRNTCFGTMAIGPRSCRRTSAHKCRPSPWTMRAMPTSRSLMARARSTWQAFPFRSPPPSPCSRSAPSSCWVRLPPVLRLLTRRTQRRFRRQGPGPISTGTPVAHDRATRVAPNAVSSFACHATRRGGTAAWLQRARREPP